MGVGKETDVVRKVRGRLRGYQKNWWRGRVQGKEKWSGVSVLAEK